MYYFYLIAIEFCCFSLHFKVFVIKEGVQYKIRIDFVVQREIVHGLKYVQKTYRMGVPGKCKGDSSRLLGVVDVFL